MSDLGGANAATSRPSWMRLLGIRIRGMYLPHPIDPRSERLDAVGVEVLALL